MSTTKRLISIREAQEILKLSRASVYRLMGDGRLTGRKIGKSIRIDIADIDTFIAGLPAAKIAPPTS